MAVGTALCGALAIWGCSPVEAWRSAIGVAKNDPDPQTAPFTRNLAAAEAAPYPNLASVPPPPTRATTAAERQKLTQSLIADRGATEAAGRIPAAATAQSGGRTPASTEVSPTRGGTVSAAAPAQSGLRKAGEPPAPQPLESSLQMPQIPALPQPEAARPPPPRPVLPPAASPAPAAATEPAAIASAMPQPPPSAPDSALTAPPAAPVKPALSRAPAATTVATLELASVSAAPSPGERAQLERVAALYKEQPGSVRVLAYAAAPVPGGDPIAGYRAALDRAQAIAKALAASGIPANKIQTEAVPALGAQAAGRVEIQLAP
jgi:hypothetical protein